MRENRWFYDYNKKKYSVENSKEKHKNVWLGWGIWEKISSLFPFYPWFARFSSLPLSPVVSILSLTPPYPFDPSTWEYISPVDFYLLSRGKRRWIGTIANAPLWVSAECRRRMAWQVISDDTKFCDI